MQLNLDNVQSVFRVYKNNTWNNYEGYKIRWDKNNRYVKDFLIENKSAYKSFEEVAPLSIYDLIKEAKIIKYHPIKVTPLREFGYIILQSGKLVLYGIMGKSAFIDLSNNRVYFRESNNRNLNKNE